MSNPQYNPLNASGTNPLLLLLSLIGITLGGVFLIGQILATAAGMIMSGVGLDEFLLILSNPTAYPEQRTMFLVMQGMASLGGFVIAPLIFYYTMVKGDLVKDFIDFPSDSLRAIGLTVIIVFSFMIVNTVFIEWNANLSFPEFLAGFETWAKNLEESMADITKYLTNFESTGYFVLAVVIVAVLPGIGEELLFRGFLQNIFRRLFKNDHVAIWLAAFLFGAIHFQFYGMLPRMLLGALFGYLYIWTGNLLIPIVAHFLNNAISLFALFIYQKGLTDFDAESTEALPAVYVLIFSVFFVISLVYFKYHSKTGNEHERLERGI
ncbi:MAG: CPBP family intramembrane metalloprotease [Cytophagales bacterium]|nr:CPBP family intramembrane metalloprotease [Cytophagales bacterium]